MAVAFGVGYIVEFPFVPAKPEDAIYTGAAAVQRHKPSFDVEVGRMGLIEPQNLRTIIDGLTSVLPRHLRIVDGSPRPASRPWLISRRVNLAANQPGIFYPLVKAGACVEPGMRVGYITDFHGRRVQELAASEAGAILSIFATPPANAGDTIAVIAVPSPRKN
jgi:predicted deacylase